MSAALRQVILFSVFLIVPGTICEAGEWIEGRVTHVRDADTIEVNNRPIRLNGIDAPELDERGGRRAKSWLTRALLHKPIRCWLNGEMTYDRWVGICYAEAEQDVGAMVISAGHARDCPRYSGGRYAKYETSESRKLPSHGYCK